jgi:hypothetical protein
MAKVKHTINIATGGGNRCGLCNKEIKPGKKIFTKAGVSGFLFGNGYCSLQCFNAKYN